MPPLFFAVAGTSSSSTAPCYVDSLSLVPGSRAGWQSARCCSFPQEVLIQLERGAEVQEIEVVAQGAFSPRCVEVYLSAPVCEKPWTPAAAAATGVGGDDSYFGVVPEGGFKLAGTIRFNGSTSEKPQVTGSARRAKLQPGMLCSGQVKLLVCEPLVDGTANPYKQVGLSEVEIWGHELASITAKQDAATTVAAPFGGDGGEIAQVLLELGIPLDIVPADAGGARRLAASADENTRRLLDELQDRHEIFIKEQKFGEAQLLAQHMQNLGTIGEELRRLQIDRDRLVAAKSFDGAEALLASIRALEAERLTVAALYETDFWFEQMAVPPM